MTYLVSLQLGNLLDIRWYYVALKIYSMEYDIIARMEHQWLTYIGILWHVICYRLNEPNKVRRHRLGFHG